MRTSADGKKIRRATRVYASRAELPYQTEEVPRASALLVCFPKLAPGGAPPPLSQRRHLGDLPIHRLYVGADRQTFVGPRATLAGATTAVDLIHHEAARLGVPLRDVTCAGTSMGAVCALAVGMMAAAGRVIVGGPPVRMGRQLKAFRTIDGPTIEAKAAAKQFLALADGGVTSPAALLDDLIHREVDAVHHPMAVHLFASRNDRTWAEVARLADMLGGHPTIACEFREGTYGAHREVAQPFYDYLNEVVVAGVGSGVR